MTQVYSTTYQTQLDFLAAIFAPDDIAEIRILPSRAQSWHRVADIGDELSRVLAENQRGQNIYIGANPRPCEGASTNDTIVISRCIFADFDKCTVDDALRRIEAAGLPAATAIVPSGHGLHAYWRLTEPMTDLAAWREVMRDLIALLDSDDSVHDPARIMRLPGTMNWKEPIAPCELLECDPERVYPLDELRRIIPPHNVKREPSRNAAPTGKSAIDRCMSYLAKCPDSVSGNRGHDAMLRAACECLRFGLADGDALAVLRWFNGQKTDPPWSESELSHKLSSAHAMVNGDFGCRLREPKKQRIAGDNEPEGGAVDRKNPLPLARGFRASRYAHADAPTLLFSGDEFHAWRNNCHSPVENAQIRKEIYGFLEPLETIRQAGENEIIEPFKPRDRDVNTVIDALKAVCYLAANAPAWIDGEGPDPSQLIVAPNGVFTITDEGVQKVCEPTPRLFVANALDYPLISEAPEPAEWLKFLNAIFEADQQRIRLLQEWIGYVLTFDTKLQKILLVLGPPRSGKGTIARIITRIIGADNVCAPTLAGLATNFGLWPLIGKQLAIIGDARLSGRSDQAIVVERLLSISGEDSLTIDRKNREPLTTRLRARLMMLSNEIPKLADSSSAVANRFVILPLQKSFLGHEDIGLTDRLLTEVPQIAAWALEGLMRLRTNGRFTEPMASDDLRQEMADLGSPISAFVREWCKVAVGQSVAVADLYAAWCCWCLEQGANHPGTVQTLGRDLRAALPGITASKLRDGDNRVPTYNGIGLTLAASEAVATDRAKKAGER